MLTSKDWIQSWTGVAVPLRDPQPEHIRVADIAHHLSQVNRFTGATDRPYSVAQHSVYVARRAGGWDGKGYARVAEGRLGLMHDAPEAYVTDVSSPLKHLIRDLYAPLEEGFMVAIALRYNLEVSETIEAAVRRADLEALVAEHRDLMGPCEREWNMDGFPEPPRDTIVPLISRQAECAFLREFEILFPEEKGRYK